VEGAGDLLVKEDVAHRRENVRIEPERELADVARARVGIQDFVQALGLIGAGPHDFAVVELEPDIVEARARVNRGGV
jgi:hypothetical protein